MSEELLNQESESYAAQNLADDGEMAGRIAGFDWANTPLGAREQWSDALASTLSVCLSSRFPMAIYWGEAGYLLYNDAWRPILGDKHPWALGRGAREVWSEIWEVIAPLFESVLETGKATWQGDGLLPMQRFGYTEECYFDYTFNPIRGKAGEVVGILNIVQETTYRVLNDRRTRLLRELAASSGSAQSIENACEMSIAAMASDNADIPFALLYLLDASGAATARLIASTGLADDHPARIEKINLTGDSETPNGWDFTGALAGGKLTTIDDLTARFGEAMPGGFWSEPTTQAVVLPVSIAGQEKISAILVAGVNPRHRLDDEYRHFFELVAAHVATALSNAAAYSLEKRRAEELTALDRAKTEFFSNVSHEFRTPLTLMLGNLEEVLSKNGAIAETEKAQIETAHRNSLRLLKLVNTLLDFSRIEAGREQAVFEPTDLSALTAELVSNFRSGVEAAGLDLKIDCPPLSEAIFVDREMWEKIVLNLVSNAFKFTFRGAIEISLAETNDAVRLKVKDSGVGIPPDQLDEVFKRFHRVRQTEGRTFEGTGIGLSLVQELVKRHGGEITVESELGKGSIFTVTIPKGKAHLPPAQITNERRAANSMAKIRAEVFLNELSNGTEVQSEQFDEQNSQSEIENPKSKILLADDNFDMREYVRRLLETAGYAVTAVADGQAALERLRTATDGDAPDLILSDVMMPRLDGFGLLEKIRESEETREIPVIMLSARAGEEAKVEGLAAGADDYLIKPFSARELIARVESNLKLARLRRESAARLGERERELAEAQRIGNLGSWQWDAATDATVGSDELLRIYGFDPEAGDRMPDFADQNGWLYPPEDWRRINEAVRQTLETGAGYELDVRAFRRGEPFWVTTRSEAVRDQTGKIVGLRGTVQDITTRKRAELNAALLADIGQNLTVLADEQEIIKMCGEKIGQHFGCDQCVFAEFDESADTATVIYAWRKNEKTFDATGTYRMEDFVTREIQATLASGNQVVIKDIAADARIHNKQAHREFGIASAVNMPFVSEGSLKAAVGLNCGETREWREDEIELLQELTRRVWTSIERARAEKALLTRNLQLDLLARTSQTLIAGERGETETLETVFTEVAAALETEFFFNFLVTEDGAETLRLATSGGLSEAQKDFFATIRFGEYLCGTVAQKREKLIVENLQECGFAEAAALCSAGVKCYAGFPLLARGKLLGTVAFATRSRTHFRAGELQLIQTVCDQLATTLARHRADEALQKSEAEFRQLANAVPQIVWVADGAGKMVYVNEQWTEFSGLTLEETDTPRIVSEVIHPDDREKVFGEWARAFETGEDFVAEARMRNRKTDKYCWFLMRSVPVKDSNGKIVRWYGTSTDITANKEAEMERERLFENEQHLRSQAEEANRLKDEFLATVSHELRTPLNAMLGWSTMARQSNYNQETMRRALEVIERSARNQNQIISDILEVSRIITGKLNLNLQPVELAQIVRAAVDTLRPAIDAKRIHLKTHADADGLSITGDPDRLQQIVWNLLSNAVKFTPENGNVEITLRRRNNFAELTLTDDGSGIEPEFLPFVFDRFRQADGKMNRKHGGLGLGLAIVRHLTELHGGSVAVTSEGLGKGATFTVRLPLKPPAAASEKDAANSTDVAADKTSESNNAARQKLGGLKILVVDDEPDSLELASFILTENGAQVLTAESVDEALRIFDREKPDLIISDVGMPVRDGYEMIREIKARTSAGNRPSVPTVALTAYARAEDGRGLLQAGYDAYLPKPVEPVRLVETILELTGGKIG
jgi:PAS domain S-box-containing protein